MLDKVWRLEHLGALVVRAIGCYAVGYVHQSIQSDYVTRAECGALGSAHGRAGELVNGFHGEAHFADGVKQRLNGEYADAVGDEGRGVLAEYDLLAQNALTIGLQEREYLGLGFRSWDDLQKGQVARRVEEVRAAEVGLEIFGPSFAQLRQRNARRVARDERSGRSELLDAFEKLLLDVQPLDDHFDDPVALGDLGQVVVKIARGDALGETLRIQRRRVGFDGGFQVAIGNGIPWPFGRGQVQQEHLGPGLGEVARNARPHHAGAQDRGAFDFVEWYGRCTHGVEE